MMDSFFLYLKIHQCLIALKISCCVSIIEKIVTKDGKVGRLKSHAGKKVTIVVTKGKDK